MSCFLVPPRSAVSQKLDQCRKLINACVKSVHGSWGRTTASLLEQCGDESFPSLVEESRIIQGMSEQSYEVSLPSLVTAVDRR